jgi:hypothetical protein
MMKKTIIIVISIIISIVSIIIALFIRKPDIYIAVLDSDEIVHNIRMRLSDEYKMEVEYKIISSFISKSAFFKKYTDSYDKNIYGLEEFLILSPDNGQESYNNYVEVNKSSMDLNSDFLPIGYYYLENNNDLDIGEYWDLISNNIPLLHGIIGVSRPAFSNNYSEATIFVSYYCGDNCGNANLYLLTFSSGKWLIHNNLNIWEY